jgi:hypothetical protein
MFFILVSYPEMVSFRINVVNYIDLCLKYNNFPLI